MFFANGQWHPNHQVAQQFDSLAAAIEAAVKFQLQGAEVVLQIGEEPNEGYDVHLDLLGNVRPPPPDSSERRSDTI